MTCVSVADSDTTEGGLQGLFPLRASFMYNLKNAGRPNKAAMVCRMNADYRFTVTTSHPNAINFARHKHVGRYQSVGQKERRLGRPVGPVLG